MAPGRAGLQVGKVLEHVHPDLKIVTDPQRGSYEAALEGKDAVGAVEGWRGLVGPSEQ